MTLDSEKAEGHRPPALARHIGLLALIVFGVGDMVGAGIYGTIGRAAGMMGNAVWVAFVGSMTAAALTGLSYASIASRYPRAAGAAYVAQRAFGLPLLAYIVGLAVTASGLTSMAATSNVFAENIERIIPALQGTGGRVAVLVAFLALLTTVNFLGIRESILMNAICALVEVGGLLFVLAVGARFWGSVDYTQTPPGTSLTSGLVLAGAVLTFFAFIGFEDILNLAEEVKNPERTLPLGLVTAIGIVALLYITVAITAVSIVPAARLADTANNGAPFVQITRVAAPWMSPWVFITITLFAVSNTSLINYVMGSRLMYGMSRQGLLPRWIGAVHTRRRTPHRAILVLGSIVLLLATLPHLLPVTPGQTRDAVTIMASATSLILLSCFALIQIALIVLKLRPGEPRGRFEVPLLVPILGVVVCGGLIAGRLVSAYREGNLTGDLLTTAIIFAVILVLYWIMRPERIGADDASAG